MWLRRVFSVPKTNARLFSAQAASASVKHEDFRTIESNPTKHTTAHIGRFYTIDPSVKKTLFPYGTIPKTFFEDAKTFNEMSIMIREPAVEVINYLNKTDYSKPVNRFVFYGEMGVGRSMQLAHLIHYGYVNGKFVAFQFHF